MREQELNQGNIIVNEHVEINDGYTVEDSKKRFEREREEENKNFSIGEPLLFDSENALLCYPVKTDKNGQPVTDTDENGNTFFVRDEEKRPYIKFIKYNTGKKAVAIVQPLALSNMLDRLISLTDKKTAKKLQSVLDTVFPCKLVNFGTFTMKGDRTLNKTAFHIFQQAKLSLYTLPVMEKNEKGKYEPKTAVHNWIEVDSNGNKQEHSITLCYYHGKEIDGAQLGKQED